MLRIQIPRLSQLTPWLEERLPLAPLREFFRGKSVPRHKYTFWYLFGGLTLLFLTVQVVTGILLAFYYSPTPATAYESVVHIVNDVPHGWLIRSLHSWSANLMIFSLFVHMFSTFLLKGYRKPRELMWISGTLLMLLVLGFGFTGYLLPWDTKAYFATLIGTEIPQSMPLLGSWGVSLLKGSEDLGAETLTRMSTIHMIILPLFTLITVSFHLLLNQLYGSSTAPGIHDQRKPIPFFPNFLYRDLTTWVVGLAAAFALATIVPWGLGEKASAFASAPLGIKPEWYFLPLYQTLKIMPASVAGLSGELLVNLLVGALILFWFLIPFIDKRSRAGQRSPLFTLIGIMLILYLTCTMVVATVAA